MIFVGPLSKFDDVVQVIQPSHVISLLSPEQMIDTPPELESDRHLRLSINDISEEDRELVTPQAGHVEEIVAFAKDWNREDPMFIHCWAGISRSTAATLITLCVHNSPGRERDLAMALRNASPLADPNKLIIQYADDILGRQGRLIEAVEAMGRPDFGITIENELFSIPVDCVTKT